MDKIDEQVQITAIKGGSTEALAEYIQSHREQLMGFIRAITGSRLISVVELDDLVQEVSASAIQSLATAPLDQFTPMEWIQQIARRRVVDAHRFHFEAQRRDAGKQQSLHASGGNDEAMGLEHLLAASFTTPSAAVSQDIRLTRMQQALGQLSEEQQAAIRLRYVDGLNTKDIAAKLNKTDVAIRVLLSRSVRQLETLLQDVKPTR
jgi:RNA polymerase sigma-70 factor (ECF subfamily)